MEERPVDRHKRAADKIKLAHDKHKGAVRGLERRPVLLAESGDRAIAGRQSLQQPDQFQIALRLPLQTARRAHLVEIAVQIKLQQIGRVVRRLAHSHTTLGMPKAELSKIERFHIALDRPHRIVRRHVIFNPRRQKARLLPARAGFECAIRHKTNRTSTPQLTCYSCPASPGKPTKQERAKSSARLLIQSSW